MGQSFVSEDVIWPEANYYTIYMYNIQHTGTGNVIPVRCHHFVCACALYFILFKQHTAVHGGSDW